MIYSLLIYLASASGSTISIDIAPIANFHQVPGTQFIYRGARPATYDAMRYLSEAVGVREVIDLQGGDLDSAVGAVIPLIEPGETDAEIAIEVQLFKQSFGITVYSQPLSSLSKVSRAEAQSIQKILQLMNDAENQQVPIYVHCAHGVDRTGLVVALYELKYLHRDVLSVWNEMHENGHDLWHTIFTFHMDIELFKEAMLMVLGDDFAT
jgi:hypothetical protein